MFREKRSFHRSLSGKLGVWKVFIKAWTCTKIIENGQ